MSCSCLRLIKRAIRGLMTKIYAEKNFGCATIHTLIFLQEGTQFIMADIIGLTCTQCKRRNYTTTINKKKQSKKLEIKKYCKWCNAPTVHKESK